MIFGIGTDIVEVKRIASIYERHGERFLNHYFMPEEAEIFRNERRRIDFLAMRFAAKEAIVKAMGTGFSGGMAFRDAGVRNNELGRPEVMWSERGRSICGQRGIGEAHVTLSDQVGLAIAFVVLMRA